MKSNQHTFELIRLVGGRRVIRISEPAAGLCLEKMIHPAEAIAGQRKALERALERLLKDKCLLAA